MGPVDSGRSGGHSDGQQGFFQGIQKAVDLVAGMGGGDGGADEIPSNSDPRRDDHDGEEALIPETVPDLEALVLVSDDDREPGGGAFPEVDPEIFQPLAVVTAIVEQAGVVFGLGLEDAEGGEGRGGLGRGQGRAENDLAAVGAEIIDDVAAGRDEAAGAGEGFGKAACLDIHAAGQAVVVHDAPSFGAEYAQTVGIIDHHKGLVGIGQVDNAGEGGDMPFDGINPVHHNGFGLGRRQFFENAFQFPDVFVLEAFQGGVAQKTTVEEGGVDALVDDEGVAAVDQGADAPLAGEVSGGGDVAGFGAEEVGEFVFQFDMVAAAAVGDAGTAGAGSPLAEGVGGGFDDPGMVAESEILIAAHHDHGVAPNPDMGALRLLDDVVVRVVFLAKTGNFVRLVAPQQRLCPFCF